MSKLKEIVEVLDTNRTWFEDFYTRDIYEPYRIQKDCLALDDYDSALRLLDVCFATRQGGQSAHAVEQYRNVNVEKICAVFETLKSDMAPQQRVAKALKILDGIEGIGSKIASVYLKFLITLADFDQARELEPALYVPLDIQLQKFLFSEVRTGGTITPNRFNIFQERINGANLGFKFDQNGNLKGQFSEIQQRLHDLFRESEINRPIVILDKLWVIGRVFCNNARISRRIACDMCMFGNLLDENGNAVCGRQQVT